MSYNGLKKISMNPYDQFESKQTWVKEKRNFLIGNEECLCDHGASNDSKKGQIYPRKCIQSNEVNIYKNWKDKSLLGLASGEEIPNFTNNEISDSNIKCNICTTQLWNDM